MRPGLDSSRWEAGLPGSCGYLIATWPWAKVSYPSPSPTLPFSSPRWPQCCACSSRGLRGCKCWGETFASRGGGDCISARARPAVPSLPPRAPRPPNAPQSLRGAAEQRVKWGTGDPRAELGWIQTRASVATAQPLGYFSSPTVGELLTKRRDFSEGWTTRSFSHRPPSISLSTTARHALLI